MVLESVSMTKGKRIKPRGVMVSPLVPKKGRPLIWGYGVADLALLFGMEERYVRRAIERGTFDPASLPGVIAFAELRRQEKEREEAATTVLISLAPIGRVTP